MFILRCPVAVLTRLHSLVMCFSVPTLNFSFLNLFFSILSFVKSEKQLVLPTVKQTDTQRKSCIYMENMKTALQLGQLIFKILWALFWIFCEHSYIFRGASPLSKVTPALWARLQWWDRYWGQGWERSQAPGFSRAIPGPAVSSFTLQQSFMLHSHCL